MGKRKSYFGKYFSVKEFFDRFMPREGIEQIETKHIAKYLGYKTSDPIQRLLYEFGLKEKKYSKNTGSRCDYKRYKWDKEKIDKFAKKYNEKYKEPKPTKQPKQWKKSPPKYRIKNVIEKMCSIENVVLNEKEKENLKNRIQVFCRKKIAMIATSCNDGKKYYEINEEIEKIIIEAFEWNGSDKFRIPHEWVGKFGYTEKQFWEFRQKNKSFDKFTGSEIFMKNKRKLQEKYIYKSFANDHDYKYYFIRYNLRNGETFPEFYKRWEKDNGKKIIDEYTAKK
jgi:hypothetical protein